MRLLLITLLLASTAANAVPATDESITELSTILVTSMIAVSFVLGFIAGQQR